MKRSLPSTPLLRVVYFVLTLIAKLLSVLTLVFVLIVSITLTSCDSGSKSTVNKSNKDAYADADTVFYHRLRGDLYRIAGKDCDPKQIDRLKILADSAKLTAPDTDHSVIVNDSDGTPYTLGIGLPRNFDRNRVYPLIIYLHGGIGTEVSTKGERAWEMFGGLRDSIDVIVASPSGNRFAPWWSRRGTGRIIHAVRYVETMYAVDTNKVFLAGVSDGATGCYAVASALGGGGPFAGFFAISGFGGMLQNLGVQLSIDNLRKRPIYNVNGGKDHLYPIEAVSGFVDYLRGEGVPVTAKVYPDEGHGFDYKEREYSELIRRIKDWSLKS